MPRGPRYFIAALLLLVSGCSRQQDTLAQEARRLWEADNPITPVPTPPLGSGVDFQKLSEAPTPERVRLGRWLFFDKRLSADGTIACASCHQPEHAFSQSDRVATGVGGQTGRRKVPPLINLAMLQPPTMFKSAPGAFFWDGRAGSLEEQALEPIANPIEMATSHAQMVSTLSAAAGYRRYFAEAFGDDSITKERVVKAIADYERTRMSGNSVVDRWLVGKDEAAVSGQVRQGQALFAGKARCTECHNGPSFSDGQFHNTGVGWNPTTNTFSDEGRDVVTRGTVIARFGDADRGAFKTPRLREVSKHAPYMHDGSIRTLREVVEFYNRGAMPNPYLDLKILPRPLGLTPSEIDALAAFLAALDGEGWQDVPPSRFPQ